MDGEEKWMWNGKKGHKDILSLKLQTKVTFMADKIFMLYLSADSR